MDALLHLVDAVEAQVTALHAQVGLLRELVASRAEQDAAAKRAVCQHVAIVRTTAMDREDEYFCGDCGMKLGQPKATP